MPDESARLLGSLVVAYRSSARHTECTGPGRAGGHTTYFHHFIERLLLLLAARPRFFSSLRHTVIRRGRMLPDQASNCYTASLPWRNLLGGYVMATHPDKT